MKVAKTYLLNEFSVVIFGKPGEGKSTASFKIAKYLIDEANIALDRYALLFEATDLKNIHSTDIDLLLIDDMFGKHNAEPGKFKAWSDFFSTLQTYISNRKIRIIMTSRMHIFMEYKPKVNGLDIFSRTVELNSEELSFDEKRCILLAQLEANNRDPNEVTIQDCVSQENSQSGFPMCAHQFAADESLYSMKEKYFSKPYKYYLEQNIRNLDEQSFISLLYVFYKHNLLKTNDLDISKIDEDSENTLLHISKLRGVEKPIAVLLRETKQKINWLKESYFRNIRKTFSFRHDTIYETVALIHGEEYSSEVINHCTPDFLCQSVNIEGDVNDGTLVIDEDDFTSLAERFVHEVINVGNGKRLSTHPMLRHYLFVEEFISVVTDSEDTFRDFFSINISFMYVGIHAFLYHVISSQGNNDCFLRAVLPLLHCKHNTSKKGTCWTCPVKSEALASVCGANREDLYNLMRDAGAKVETLCLYKAVENHEISPEFVKRIFYDLKAEHKFIPDQELLQFCLGMSTQHKDTRVFNILKEAGLQPTSALVYYIAQVGNADLLTTTIDELIKDNKWMPDTMSLSRAIVDGLMHNKQNILEILDNAGAKLTEFAVYWAIVDYGFDAVSCVVEKLKENDTFDEDSRDMAWGLAMAIKKKAEDERILKKLQDEGVTSTLSLVGALAETGQSAAVIRNVIDELKAEERWDADDYSVAVAYMAALKRPDTTLKIILENEGAKINPACLNYVVIRYADEVDSVIQTLKDKSGLLSSNKYIARALVLAMESRDKTVYEQLIQEGIQLSMACLVYAVERFISVSTLENVIAGLKDEKNWASADDCALEALCVANKRQDKTAYLKLLSEGVTWRPRSLYIAVKCETVYGLKRVIKQLRENDILDGSDKDTEEAMALAMRMTDKRKYSVLKESGF